MTDNIRVCLLDCKNGGVCKLGDGVDDDIASDFLDDDDDYGDEYDNEYEDLMYCDCPPVWTGNDCTVPVENCADGKHFCL